MYYLWKDKGRSTENKEFVFITDYLERNKEGKVWVDGFGFTDLELLFQHDDKEKCIAYATNKTKL